MTTVGRLCFKDSMRFIQKDAQSPGKVLRYKDTSGRARVKCELRVAKVRVGILRVQVRAKCAST